MAPDRAVRISRRILDRYLLDDEIPVVATRRHWARLVEPFVTALVGLILVAGIAAVVQREFGSVSPLVWAVWFVLGGRALWHLLEWHNEWFVATDRRMLLVYGLVTHKVAMMPLAKVTDMNYGRSLLGRMLGYGQFVLESAGQEQALREIRWVPDPDETYRRICATIFSQQPSDRSGSAGRRVDDAFDEDVEQDPFEATFHDEAPSIVDRFDPDVVRLPPGGRSADGRAARRRRRSRWESVERHELPTDWDWVEDEARAARTASRARVAVDPDPTPTRRRR